MLRNNFDSLSIKNNTIKHYMMNRNKTSMTKNREKQSNYLMTLGRKAKGDITPEVAKVIELYNLGKISQVQTAENMILTLLNAKTERKLKSAIRKYNKLIGKHETQEPLNVRLKK